MALAWTGLVALAARLAVAIWAKDRFPPAHDGVRYHRLAQRLADGLGYSWQWPDGVTTLVAHYPVGYPALLAAAYRLLGATPFVASLLNVVLGCATALLIQASVRSVASGRAARIAGMAVALHPGLVLYTPGIMSECAFCAFIALSAWATLRVTCSSPAGISRDEAGGPDATHRDAAWWVLISVAGAVAVLIRPQALLCLLCFGWVAASRQSSLPRRMAIAIGPAVAAAALCLPWTLRNCTAVERCVFVSANGGENLLIGAQPGADGKWQPLEVPTECAEIFGESKPDLCFSAVAARMIREAPLRWLALIPRKLAATFDYGGIGGYYLHLSNAAMFPFPAVLVAGAVETLFERLAIALCLLGVHPWGFRRSGGRSSVHGPASGPFPRIRRGVSIAGMLVLLTPYAWMSVVALLVGYGLRGLRWLETHPLQAAALGVFLGTVAVHAVFFGAPRFSVVTYPWAVAMAVLAGMESSRR